MAKPSLNQPSDEKRTMAKPVRKKLTDQVLQRSRGGKRFRFVYDTEYPGMALGIGSSGSITLYFKGSAGGRKVTKSICPARDLTREQAIGIFLRFVGRLDETPQFYRVLFRHSSPKNFTPAKKRSVIDALEAHERKQIEFQRADVGTKFRFLYKFLEADLQ